MLKIILLLALAGLGVAYYFHQNKSTLPAVSTMVEMASTKISDATSSTESQDGSSTSDGSYDQNSATIFAERRAGLAGKPVPQGFKVGLRQYEDVVINSIDGAFVSFNHKDGIGRLRIADIENDQMKQFIGWSKEESDAIEAGLAGTQSTADSPPGTPSQTVATPASSPPPATVSSSAPKEDRQKKYQQLQGRANVLGDRISALLKEKGDLESSISKSNIKNSRTTQSMRLEQVVREIASLQAQLNTVRQQIGAL